GRRLAPGLVALLQRRRIPQANRAVPGAGRQRLAALAEGQRPDVALVPGQPHHLLAPRHVPQPDRPVAAARGQPRAVGVEGDGVDLIGVAAQHLARAAADLPQADGVVPTARGEAAAVGTEGGLEDGVLVTAEAGGSLVRPRIQEQYRFLIRSQGGQPTAVGAVRQGRAFGREQRVAGRDVVHGQATYAVLRVVPRCGHSRSVRTYSQRIEVPVVERNSPANTGR